MAPKQLPRGIRNHNPGNIRHGKSEWKGMSADQSGDTAFVTFDAPEWGLRAIVRVLRSYYDRYGLRTIRKMIDRYAPPNENPTAAYIKKVADELGVDPDDEIEIDDMTVLVALVRTIVRVECGPGPLEDDRWYDDEAIVEGIRLA
jgi:hypothetical protein